MSSLFSNNVDDKEMHSNLHKFILSNVAEEVANKEAWIEENGLLKKACSSIKSFGDFKQLIDVLTSAEKEIPKTNNDQLGEVLRRYQDEIQAHFCTEELTEVAGVKIRVGSEWNDATTAALRALVKAVQDKERSIRQRQGAGYQGSESNSAYQGDESKRLSGGIEALRDLTQSIAFSSDQKTVHDRVNEINHGLSRLSRALVSCRPLYSDHKAVSASSAKISIDEIREYGESLSDYFSQKLTEVISEEGNSRKKSKISREESGKFTFCEGKSMGEDVFSAYNIGEAIESAAEAIREIVINMTDRLDQFESAQERYANGVSNATGDINNLSMVRYDCMLAMFVHKSNLLEKILEKTYNSSDEKTVLGKEVVSAVKNFCSENKVELWAELETEVALHMICLLVICLFRQDHDAIFGCEKLRFNKQGISGDRFPALGRLDSFFGSDCAGVAAALLNESRTRKSGEFYTGFTILTFARLERSVGVFTPLVTSFGLLLGSEDKLRMICELIVKADVVMEEFTYLLHQLLACGLSRFFAAKYKIKQNVFDSISIDSDSSSSKAKPKRSSKK